MRGLFDLLFFIKFFGGFSLFKECPHPDEKQRLELSKRLCLETRQVKFWFQNRRTQMKVTISNSFQVIFINWFSCFIVVLMEDDSFLCLVVGSVPDTIGTP